VQIARLGIWEYEAAPKITHWDERCREIFGVSEARPKSAAEFLQHGEAPRAAGLDTADLAAYTSIASLMLNLDETVTKE